MKPKKWMPDNSNQERKMTMKAKTTNNMASTKKKLIPAAGSLAISAVMLATST